MNKGQLDNATAPRSVVQQQACSPAVVCRECGPTCKYGEGDEIRPCVKCGETIGHGAGQHTCECCGDLCCTACSHDADSTDHPNWDVLCDDCQCDHGCSCCEDGQETSLANVV